MQIDIQMDRQIARHLARQIDKQINIFSNEHFWDLANYA